MYRVLGIAAVSGLVLLSIGGSVAEDRDEFYAIARGEDPRAPRAASGGWFPFRRQAQAPQPVAHPAATPARRQAVRQQAREIRQASLTGDIASRTFCVRTCDGYFFPVGPIMRGAGREAQAGACAAMCPGAEVQLYSSRSGAIDDARGTGGRLYTASLTAFRHRGELVAGCSCQGSATRGLAGLPIARDHTLRAGDAVVTAAGVRLVREGARFPYRPRDFVTAAAYGRLPADLRRRVQQIETASLRPAAPTTTARTTTFARASRLEPLREMIAVRHIAITRAAAGRGHGI